MAKLFCYTIDREGRYPDPIVVEDEDLTNGFAQFVVDNVEKHYELRVTDMDDKIVFHVVDQTLVFPLTEGMSPSNKWSADIKRFITVVGLQE